MVVKWDYTGDCDSGYRVEKVQIGTKHHDAITHQEERTVVVKPAWDETVIVKPAWDETVITGYKCSCGLLSKIKQQKAVERLSFFWRE